MKRFLILVLIFVAVFAVSCSKKKSHDYEERVSKKITAEEGGTVESSDGKTSVEIPAGALDEDTTITMTVYESEGYKGTDDVDVITKVIEFEPSGTVFKKPVIITMASEIDVDNKIVSAAVYNESKGEWSYDEHGAYALLLQSKDEDGAPLMTTAGGDPIMLNAGGDPIMMSAGGDPIMLASAGDPIMLASAGDPIMTNAAGDPIMMSAAGDPIMMTTGHFTAYTFIMLTPKEYVEPDDDEPVAEPDDDEPAEPDDDEPAEPDDDNDPTEPADEDIVPEPEKVYSLVPCTGFTFCVNDNSKVIECPGEGEEFYGQDAQYAIRRSCVPRSFKTFPLEEDEMQDNITGLTWLFADVTVDYTETEEHTFCTELDYDGYDDWRFPTPKELNTLAVHNKSVLTNSNVFPQTYLQDHGGFFLAVGGETNYYYSAQNGDLTLAEEMSSYYSNVNYICVRGEEYGKVGENVYEESGEGSEKVVFDHSTNLLWQKGSVSGKSWKEALEYCENLEYAGYEDWRLPNRNELMTLADYSKAGTGLVSSFPGMEAEQFVVSTSSLGFPEVGYWTYQWSVSMNDGTLSSLSSEEEKFYSVRCVRSDLDAAPADGIPECDEKIGYTPCRDTANGIVWSMVIMEPDEETGYYEWYGTAAAEACTNAVMHGKNKWRLPTVDELRTLMKEDKLKVGGECGVTTASCLDRSCYEETKCSFDEDYVFESKFLDYEMLVSGDIVENDDHVYDTVWVIDPYEDKSGFSELSIYEEDSSSVGYVFSTVVRCVLDESLSGEETPYDDPQTGLSWSDISTNVTYSEAEAYCTSLNEGSDKYWRMPSATELQTLVINCEDAPCKMTMDGRYSVFGDTGYLWVENGETNALNFSNADFASLDTDSFYNAGVRCVSDSPSPCAGDPCAAVENSTGMCIPLSQEGYKCECEDEYSWTDDACLQVAEAG